MTALAYRRSDGSVVISDTVRKVWLDASDAEMLMGMLSLTVGGRKPVGDLRELMLGATAR